MNKPKSQFASLPETDRQHILDLCSKNGYARVADLLAKPHSEGGLGILTSAPALCRFYTSTHEDSGHVLLAQYAAVANIRHEQDSNAFIGAIRANVEARVFENLRAGKALADMEKDFRFLKIAENLYLADAQWRASNPKAARAAYQRHVDRCATAPEIDFLPVEQATAHPEAPTFLDFPSDFDLDLIKSRERQNRDAETHREILATLQASPLGAQTLPVEPPHSPRTLSKPPVIPPIPHNSTKPSNHHQPNTTTPPKPAPYIAPPKISRNDPCPCSSGRKSKKCCHP